MIVNWSPTFLRGYRDFINARPMDSFHPEYMAGWDYAKREKDSCKDFRIKSPTIGKVLSAELRASIVELLNAGELSWKQIASATGVSYTTIRRMFYKLKAKKK